MTPARLLDLGRRPYAEVWALQRRLVAERIAGVVPDTLVLVEHDHVITLGRGARDRRHVVAPGDTPVLEIERGGDVTYHGPGQLVGYPIFALAEAERDLHRFLRGLEQALIDALAGFSLAAGRRPGWTGVWVGDRKIASIGVAVRRWVTYHGFALNVATDLARFSAIEPCGLPSAAMTSMAELGRAAPLPEVARAVAAAIAVGFGRDFADAPLAPTPGM